MFGDILQPTHLLLILAVALLVLGPKRLPEVGRSLGSGLRDFKAAINGESVHEDRPPHAYFEPEPDPVPTHEADASETEPVGLDLSAEESAETNPPENGPATPTSLHDLQLDPQTVGDDLHAPATVGDLHPPAATEPLPPAGDLYPPAPSEDLPDPVAADEPDSAPTPVAAGSRSGFASALASSRQQSVGGVPAADDDE